MVIRNAPDGRRVEELAGAIIETVSKPYNGDTGRLTGFEALLRWTHPEFGQLSPAKFIPIAEEARLIGPIGEWVVRTVCAEAAGWPDDVRIAVNVSPEKLHNPGFVTVVASPLAGSRLPADRLELEVTESVFMEEGTGAPRCSNGCSI